MISTTHMVNNASNSVKKIHRLPGTPTKFCAHLNRYVVRCLMERTTIGIDIPPRWLSGCLIFKADIFNIVSFCFYSLVIFILNPILR